MRAPREHQPSAHSEPSASAIPHDDERGDGGLSEAELEAVIGGLERVFVAYQAERARTPLDHGVAPP